jgi:hypothetical protein
MTKKEAMLAAHLEYELAQYAPANLPRVVEGEVAALYAWLATVPVSQLLPPPVLTAFLQRNVLDRPLPPDVVDFVRENLVVALEIVQEDQTRLHELLPKPLFDRIVTGVAKESDMRRQVIGQIVSSSVYSRLIANVLYHGIKSFLVTENGMARAIPGASSLLRLSQSALNATVPQMEKNVDKQLIAFIDENIQQTIADSEAFLNRSLDESVLQRVGDEIWQSLGNETLARLTRSLDKDALLEGTAVAQQVWEHLRATPIAQDILGAVVRSFYLRYGKQDVRTLLISLGLDEAAAGRELLALATPLAAQALAGGYLEARIRTRLQPFYDHYFAAVTE